MITKYANAIGLGEEGETLAATCSRQLANYTARVTVHVYISC